MEKENIWVKSDGMFYDDIDYLYAIRKESAISYKLYHISAHTALTLRITRWLNFGIKEQA